MQHPIDATAPDVLPSLSAQAATAGTPVDGQSPGDGREQEAPQEADGTEQKAAATQVHLPSPVLASQASQQDRYDYDLNSIILVAHFRPVSQEGQPRQVWLSAQNGVGNEQDFPLYRVLSEADLGGPWPPAVVQLLENLRQDLPARKQRYEARQATKPAATAAPSSPSSVRQPAPVATASSRHGKVQAKQVETGSAAPTPVVPSTATPIPKQELGMAGLFEGLE